MGLISAEDRGPFHGPAGRWIETLASLYTDHQMNAFVFWPSGDRERQSRIWAEEVVPRPGRRWTTHPRIAAR